MATKQEKPGYVYILTNPSFREDWVKIGKSSRPVDVRSKELDNTAVPLPFEIYATMKTVKYNEAEKLVHGLMDQLTDKRIRKNREFFNLRPEEALTLFQKVAMVIDDVEIEFTKNTKPGNVTPNPKKKPQPSPLPPKETFDIKPEDLTGKITFVLNGNEYKAKSMIGYAVVKNYLEIHRNTSIKKLKKIFYDDLVQEWAKYKFIQDDIKEARTLKEKTSLYRHQVKDEYILTSGDGVDFVVNNQWCWKNIPGLLEIVKNEGWSFSIKK